MVLQKQEIEISGRKIVVKELTFDEGMDALNNPTASQKDKVKSLLYKAVEGMSTEEINNLSMRDGIKLLNLVNELNGFNEGFTIPKSQ